MENIGVKIEVDGGKAFRAELDAIKQTSKSLAAELKNVVNGLDSTGDQAEDTRKRIALLEQLWDEAGKKVNTLTKHLQSQEAEMAQLRAKMDEARATYGATSPEVQKLTTEIHKQEAAIGKTKTQLAEAKGEYASYDQQLDAAEEELRQVTDASKKAGKATADAGKDAEKASKGGWTMLKGVLSNLAATAIRSVISSLKSLSSDAVKASDAMSKFAQTLSFGGFGAEEIEKISAAMKEYADQTVYDLDTVANTVAQLGANGVKDFEKLTEAAGNLNAVAGGNAQTFESVALVLTQTAGAGKLTTENWKQMMNQIPGAAGVLKDALLDMGAYTGNFEEALKKGKITAEEFNAAIMQVGNQPIAVEAATSAVTFEGAIGNLKATVVSALQEMISMVGMENITGFINRASSFISGKLMPAIKMVAGWLRDNLLPIVKEVGAWIQENILPIIQDTFVWIKDKLVPVIIEIVKWLAEYLGPIIRNIFNWLAENLLPVVREFISSIQQFLIPVINKLMEVIKPVANFIRDVFARAWERAEQDILGIIDAGKKVAEFFKKLSIKIPEIKLPHFKVSGKFSLNPLEVPKLSIDWYDKGGIFRSPSIIGVGEKRPEFVGALDDLRQIFREEAGVNAGVTINVYASDNMNVNELADIIQDKIQAGVMRRSAVYA